jgi:hypothetical protein
MTIEEQYLVIRDTAKRLIEELHEPFSNEDRWRIAETHLKEMFMKGAEYRG